MTSNLFDHSQRVYEIMQLGATDKGYWSGKVRELQDGLGLGGTTVSKAIQALKDMGCVERTHKGAAGNPSLYKLIEFPTLDHWHYIRKDVPAPDKKVPEGFKPKRVTSYQALAISNANIQEMLVKLVKNSEELEKRVSECEQKLALIAFGKTLAEKENEDG